MAPFFKSSFLFRRRHTDKVESTPPSPISHSHSLPNLEELRGISASFFDELSPLLQSRPVQSLSSPVLSAHVSIFSPGQSSKAPVIYPCINVAVGPDSGTIINALDSITLEEEVPASPAISSCSSLATVRTTNIWSIGISSEDTKAVEEMNDAFGQVEAMLSNDSEERTVLLDECAYHERLISDMNNELDRLRDSYHILQAEEQTLSNENHALMLQNEKLNKELTSNDDFKRLRQLDDQIIELTRTINHMISTEMNVSVLRAANYCLQRGADASNALFLALRIAVSNAPDGDPWRTIMGPQQMRYSYEEHEAATKQNAELDNEIRLMDKKYRLWKIKAQMNAKYARYVTPSSSEMSLLLNSLERAPKKWPEDVNNILDKFEHGYEIKMRAVVGPVIAPGPSGSQKSPRAEISITASPVATNAVVSLEADYDGTLLPRSSEVVLSSGLSMKVAEDVLPSAQVVLSPALSQKLTDADSLPALSLNLAEVVLPSLPLESAVVLPPALSSESTGNDDAASATSKEPTKIVVSAPVVRRYIPGLTLFGGNGLGPAPPGLFSPPSESEGKTTSERGLEHHLDSQESSPDLEYISEYQAQDNQDVEQRSAKSSPSLEYIEEYPADGRRNPVLLQSDDSSSGSIPTTNFMNRDSSMQVSGRSTPSSSVRNAVQECIMDHPAEGKYNSVLHDCNGDCIEISQIDNSSNYEQINNCLADGRRNPVLRDDSLSEDSSVVVRSPKLARVEKLKDESILSTIARSASSSISNLKRISSASSSIKRSISGGLKRLRQITLKPHKKQRNSASAGSRSTPSHQRQISSIHTKENTMPRMKKQNTGKIVPEHRISAPPKGVYRPTISSTLKTVNNPQQMESTTNPPPKAVRLKVIESSARRAPLIDVATRSKPVGTRQKVLNQSRKAVQSLVRLIS